MLLYKSTVYIIIFNVLWQMSLLIFEIVCLNRKRMIFILILINAFISGMSWKFLVINNEPINIKGFLLTYFIVFFRCLLIFEISINKIVLGEKAIIEGFKSHNIMNYSKYLLVISFVCLSILIFNMANYNRYFTRFRYSYCTISILLIVNSIINLILSIKVKNISNRLNN